MLNPLRASVSADLVGLAAEFDVSIQAMSRALGTALVATLAIATMVWSMLSVTWGKRPVYLASTLIMLAGCIVSGEGSYCSPPHYVNLIIYIPDSKDLWCSSW